MINKSAKKVSLQKVLVYDLDIKDFRFFKNFFETHLTEDLIEGEKVDQIKNLIANNLPWEYKRDWVIVVGRDLAYNMQSKKNKLLIFKIGNLAFFIYQGKYLDMPSAEPVELFDNFQFTETKIDSYKARISLQDVRNEKELNDGEHFRTWLAKFCVKFENDLLNNYDQFEKLLLKKIKVELMLHAKEGFWNIYIGPRVSYAVENVKAETEMLYTLDFTGCEKNKGKKTLAIFQKKGETDSYLSTIKNKKKEALGFIGMLILFIALVGCRDYTPLNYEYVDPNAIRSGHIVKDEICQHQQTLIYIGGAIFFSYIGGKLVSSVRKGKAAKKKAR